jgi:hypothetical protein
MEFIGDCYVHRLMDGKLWNTLEGGMKVDGRKARRTYRSRNSGLSKK